MAPISSRAAKPRRVPLDQMEEFLFGDDARMPEGGGAPARKK